MTSLRKILALLTPHERRRAVLLLGMILVMAFLDMVGVASIMPFLAVLASPEVIETNSYLNAVYTRLNFTDPQAFLFLLSVVVFAALLTFTVDVVVALAYGLIYRCARGYLGRIGHERRQANTERFEIVSEAFGGIKDVKVGGLEQAYTRRFEKPAHRSYSVTSAWATPFRPRVLH